MNKRNYMFAYNTDLYRFLRSQGIEHLCKARHHRTYSLFYIFERTEQLDHLVEQYNAMQAGLPVQSEYKPI